MNTELHVEQIYTGCLAQGAYYITSNGEAAIIDPLREIQPYLDQIEKDGVKLKYVFETHFHADFVSGHIDLAEATGATIVYGPTAQPDFEAHIAEKNEEFTLGNVTLKALHTPGHTMESTTYLLRDESGKDYAIFTGDTLFIGDVGRPDLAQKAADMTQEQLASTLYHSLRNELMPLADDVLVYPAHGAGSACGKNMSDQTVSTMGAQKKTNYALREDMTEAEFVKEVLDGLTPPPAYFGMNVAMNKGGYEHIDEVLEHGLKAMTPEEFEEAANATEAVIIDSRDPDVFAEGFVPRSINIGLQGMFAPWVGTLIVDVQQPILLVAEPGTEKEAVTRMARVGFDNVIGYLDGGFASWQSADKETDEVRRVTAEEFEAIAEKHPEDIVDVRRGNEYAIQHVQNVKNVPLDYLSQHMSEFTDDKPYVLHCAGGYRSMIAASILKARGIHNVRDVVGGFGAISKTHSPLSEKVVCAV